MIRRKNSRGLIRQGGAVEEDVNPNSYITNLADCMLVVTVGLLVALVAHYGIDLNGSSDDPVAGVEVVLDADGDGMVTDDGYSEAGRVYQDSATGKYYLVTE